MCNIYTIEYDISRLLNFKYFYILYLHIMNLHYVFLFALTCADIVITQSPSSLAVSLEEKFTMSFKYSQILLNSRNKNKLLASYQQIPGQTPKHLIYYASTLESGVPDRFIGSDLGQILLSPSAVSRLKTWQIYYRQQWYSYPSIVLQFPTKTSSERYAFIMHIPGPAHSPALSWEFL